ncbi:MAG: conjugal transfer protein TraR [Methylomonas sp.]|nr:MAG: conjugal transfer protein TraR [Methylomonas sp.]
MIGIESLQNPEQRMTNDDLSLQAEQFDTNLALLKHQQTNAHAAKSSALFCVDCGAEIPLARRNALPGIDICIDCARDEERRAKQWL